MIIKNLFAKPIDRPIIGVIKADDLSSLQTEVEEYVITNEIQKDMELFFASYKDYQGANGVWISGFFGSGKSHLLKMLALLLNNAEIGGRTMLEYFEPKIDENALLKGDMADAVKIPSHNILFNIDQKADTISKTEIDAVLAVFVKVFNEMLGYYGKQGYVAQFERDLASRDLYEPFKEAYKSIAGKEWETGREQVILEKNSVAEAYARVTGEPGESQKNIIDAYRQDYRLSIEDFAEQVNDFIQAQAPGFRLNFFVDEVGQYIADNIKLMTNLQTLAESLATRCKGQAWIVVTSQEEMKTMLGEDSKQQSNDFSKIQARFKTRMKLTSKNVDEVIQKRLLKKNSDGEAVSRKLYQEERNHFGTLFDFADGATVYRNFLSEQHFIDCYPFIPYQFTLFQSAIETLSQRNAFTGKHQSVGERSMLEVFQVVTNTLTAKKPGALATFDRMYEGIRATLKSQIQSAINKAEQHLTDPLAVRVLKAMMLVKYIKGFRATPRNLRVLMQERFDQDLPELSKRLQAALDLLEQQTYIQRSGEVYEYLTDEEKDIEAEIKQTEIETSEVLREIEDYIFAGIIRDTRIRHEETKYDYRFTRRVDDRNSGKEYELAVHVVTPFHENAGDIQVLQSHSLGKPELLVVLPPDVRLMEDLKMLKRTERYYKHNQAPNQTKAVIDILAAKSSQNEDRKKQIHIRLNELIGRASFFVSGVPVEVSGEDPRSRILRAFQDLIVRTYPNLRMLRGMTFQESDIRRHLEFSKQAVLDGSLSEAEQEVLASIQSSKNMGTLATMKALDEKFSGRPYGWPLVAVQCLAAMLAGRGKIEARSDAVVLNGADLERALTNTHGFGNLILEPQAVFTAGQVKRLKDFYNQFFDKPASGQEGKILAEETRAELHELAASLRELAAQKESFPFLCALDEPIEQLRTLVEKDYTFFLEELPRQEDELLDLKENILDPIRRFMAGTNKAIYEEAKRFMEQQQSNFDAVGNGKPEQVRAILADPGCYRGSRMQELKQLVDGLRGDLQQQIEKEKKAAVERVRLLHDKIETMPDYGRLTGEQKQEVEKSLTGFELQVQDQELIAVIRDKASSYETGTYSHLLNRISSWASAGTEQKIEYVQLAQLGLKYSKPYLESEEDIEQYLDAVRRAMLEAIEEKKRIQV